MSQRRCCGRRTPRWSVATPQPAFGMTFSARLPGLSGIVCVGPPFDPSTPRFAPTFRLSDAWWVNVQPAVLPTRL